MNIFEHLADVVFIEDEDDIYFACQKLNISNAKIGDVIKIKEHNLNQKEYVVKPLDTITSVAQKLNITEQELYSRVNCKTLYVGQKIKI